MKRATLLLVCVAACATPEVARTVEATEPARPVEVDASPEAAPAATIAAAPESSAQPAEPEAAPITTTAPEPAKVDRPAPEETAPKEDVVRTPPTAELTPEITAEQFLTRAAFLASDDLEGRESGTASGKATEEYVASEFRRLGYEFLGDGDPFVTVLMPMRTPLPYKSGVHLVGGDGVGERIACPPFAFCKPDTVEGDLAFVGYGLVDPDNGYDDYAEFDVEGKVVLVLRHGPREADRESPWFRRNRQAARKLAFSTKAMNAQNHGAAAVLLVQDMHHRAEFLPVSVPGPEMAIPVLNVTRKTADALIAGSGKDLKTLQEAIDSDTQPRSYDVTGVRLRVTAALGDQQARNVVAVKRGTDPELSKEAVIVGAHMDHVGHGWFGSPSGPGSIHNGADDNGSGTAAVLEIAEALAGAPATKRTILIALWCGEEKGLVGSAYFVRNPTWDIKQISTCVNLDMVGRYRDGEKDAGVTIGGAPTGSGLEERVLRLGKQHELKITQAWTAWNQSDHAPFYRADIPSLFFSTGLHADYHRPGDDWWKLNAEPAARIATMARDLVVELADADDRPTFKKKPPRPILGVRLSDAPEKGGALIVQVFPRFGAAMAGLQANDVIVRFDGKPVTSVGDLTALIAATKPGTSVDVVYLRKGEETQAKVRISGM